MKGKFSMEDMAAQLAQLRKIGNVDGLLGMLPGIGKVNNKMAQANISDSMIAHQEAIICSMTLKERKNPKLINGSRRKRIAMGSGTSVQEVNRLLKQFKQMATMVKKAGKKGKNGLFSNMPVGLPPGVIPGR